MKKYVVEIGDQKGQAFKVEITVPLALNATGYWRVLDKGFIKYNSGVARKLTHLHAMTTRDLQLDSGEFTDIGIHLTLWEDLWVVNDQGKGMIIPDWVITLDPGKNWLKDNLSWVLVG